MRPVVVSGVVDQQVYVAGDAGGSRDGVRVGDVEGEYSCSTRPG